jgi:hypothetical protein
MEAKLKHLEFIQATIGRMAKNSFLFKGWAITIAAALSALAAHDSHIGVLFAALVPTLLFWGLDAYYLWLERGFVALHNRVSAMSEADIDFSMAIDKGDATVRWLRTCSRRHLVAFYGTILAVNTVEILIFNGGT